MVDIHVGRQPIYTRNRSIHGYELLFRADVGAAVATSRDDTATSTVICAAMLEFGLPRLTAPHLAFVNITRAFAVGDLPLPLPTKDVVLELLEDVPVDAAVRRGMHQLAGEGFRLALDDFEWTQDRLDLLPLASYVKIDITGKDAEELHASVERLRQYDVLTIAERVENADELETCLSAGFDLMQGYHLLRPATLSARGFSPAAAGRLELVSRLSDPDVSLRDIEPLVSADAALTLQMMRAVTSASAGLAQPVDSLPAALMQLGLDRIRAWATLMALGGDDQDPAAAAFVLTRGRFCQLQAAGLRDVAPGPAFLAGILSAFEHVLALPAAELVEQLPLSAAIRVALTERSGPLGALLTTAEAYDGMGAGRSCPVQYGPSDSESYLTALAWSHQLTTGVGA